MKRVHLIAPVLWTGIHSLPDVVVYIEKLNGSRGNASRRFECILIAGERCLCIIEAKNLG